MRKILAIICALTLLLCMSAQAEEMHYDKLENEENLFDPSFMKKYVDPSFPDTALFQGCAVNNQRAFFITDANDLYGTRSMETPDTQFICHLTDFPKDWWEHYRDGTLTDEEIEQMGNVVTNIVIRDRDLYGFSSFSGKFGRISGAGPEWNEVRLDVSALRNDPDDIRARSTHRVFLTDDDQFYTMTYDENWEYFDLHRFDLATGKCRTYKVNRMVNACPYKDGEFMVQRVDENGAYVISSLNLETEELTDLDYDLSQFDHENIEKQACGLAYNGYDGVECIVVASDGLIYRIYPGEKPRICDTYKDVIFYESVPTVLIGCANYMVCSGYMSWCMLYEYGEEIEPDAVDRVVIAGGIPHFYDGADKVLQEECGDITVHEVIEVTGEELADQLNTKNDSVDIYVLPADSTYYSILRKGLAADLSSSLTISEDVEAMYEPIRELLVNGQGQVVAYPADLRVRRFGINEGYWNQVFPDRPLPRTFSEVMDAWIEWEENWAEEYRGVGFFMGEFDYADTVRRLISLYVEQHADEELPDLTAPALREVLEKLQRVYEIRTEAGRSTSYDVPDELLADTGETGPGIVFWCDVRDAAYVDSTATLTYDSDYIHGVLKAHWTPLNITFEADAAPYTGARMSVYVVNPYTKHLGDAIRVVEALTERAANPYLYYAAYPEHNEPYEKPGFEDELRRSEEQVKLYEASIEKAKAAGKDTDKLEGQLNYYKTLIENQESEKWVVSQETIDAYRKTVEECPLRLNAQSPYSDQDGGLSTVISQMSYRLADGQVTLDEMLSTIQDRAKMMYLENK